MDGLSDLGVLPVEIGLLFGKQAKVVLICGLVVLPCATLEVALPVVGGLAVTLSIVTRGTPDVPVTERVVLGLSGFLEPFVLVRGVVHNEVENELHAAFVELVTEDVDVRDVSVGRVDDFVVADIVALRVLMDKYT